MIKYSAFELLEHLKYGNRNISELDLKDNLIMILENISSIETDEIMLPEGGVDDDFLDSDIDRINDLIDSYKELSKGDILNYLEYLCKELVLISLKVNGQFEDYQKSVECEFKRCNELLESIK